MWHRKMAVPTFLLRWTAAMREMVSPGLPTCRTRQFGVRQRLVLGVPLSAAITLRERHWMSVLCTTEWVAARRSVDAATVQE